MIRSDTIILITELSYFIPFDVFHFLALVFTYQIQWVLKNVRVKIFEKPAGSPVFANFTGFLKNSFFSEKFQFLFFVWVQY